MTVGGMTHSAQSADGLIDCRLASELLQTGQYEQVVAVLSAAQTRCARVGDAFTAYVLEMASHLALACNQCRQDAAWHLQAHQEAERREQGLREQLNTALRLIGAGQASSLVSKPGAWGSISLPAVELLAPARGGAGRSRLWQQILALVGQKKSRQATPPAQWEALLTPTEQALPEPATVPPALPGQPGQIQPASPDLPEQASPAQPEAGPVAQDKPDVPSLAVYCLGHFEVYQDEQPIEQLTGNKSKSILKYLITHREQPAPKEVLMELFWPGAHPDAARNNLNVAIYGLRQALRETRPTFSHILFQNNCYLLNPDLDIWVDSEAFLEHVAKARRLEQDEELEDAIREYSTAEAIYRGEFLAEDRYEDWPSFQRQQLQEAYLGLLDRLARYYFAQENYTACAMVCNKTLLVDSCCEETHSRLMRCYSRQGQRYLALRQYHLCVDNLAKELDVAPALATVELYQHICLDKRV